MNDPHTIIERYRKRPDMPVPGKPFGWPVVMLKARINARLITRGMPKDRAYFRTERIYERIMRYQPSFSDYCAAQRAVRSMLPVTPAFTVDQLRHIAEMWQDANDPMSRKCAAVARALLDNA